MSEHSPFRFGIQASSAPDRTAWVELARAAEANGYSCLTMPDHFDGQLAPVPALMAAADATTTLRIGALVWDNDYKHPVVLAKELATVDLLSEGRLEIGLGAGWMTRDYEQSGITYDPPSVRIGRLVEGLHVIRSAMADGAFTFDGAYYRIAGYDGLPKPLQRPHPPILIGGGGRRVLTIAAREADIVGINPTMSTGAIGPDAITTMSADAVDDKVGIVREAAGERWADVEMNVRVFMVNVTADATGATEGLARMLGVETELIHTTPFALVGPPSKLVDDLLARRERWGFSYVVVGAEDVERFAPVVAQLRGR